MPKYKKHEQVRTGNESKDDKSHKAQQREKSSVSKVTFQVSNGINMDYDADTCDQHHHHCGKTIYQYSNC